MLVDKIKKIPNSSGIYLFYNKKKELVYVGKATSLKSRVRSYFRDYSPLTPLSRREGNSRPIEQMIHEVVDIKVIQTDSVLEAIILEANTIKKYQPKYNVDLKDDKSWNYIVITKNIYPEVKLIRGRKLETMKLKKLGNKEIKKMQDLNNESFNLSIFQSFKFTFGPYPGLKTKEMMKLLRKLFYISDCQNLLKHKNIKTLKQKPCFYYQIGQCLGVCTGEISVSDYKKKVIKPLVQFLSGKKKSLLKNLEREMKLASKNHEFEEAGRLRDQIKNLQKIQDIALLNKSFVSNTPTKSGTWATLWPLRAPAPLEGGYDQRHLFHEAGVSSTPLEGGRGVLANGVVRIEGYDISNLGSTGMVGSMVVFDEQGPVKSEYRKFKIKTVKGQSDVDCLAEVIERRLKHVKCDANILIHTNDTNNKYDWPLPDVFLIDGGLPQVNVVIKRLKDYKIERLVIGIAKGPERKKNEFIYVKNDEIGKSRNKEIVDWISDNKNLLIQVRDEAHRFAINYQRSLRKLK